MADNFTPPSGDQKPFTPQPNSSQELRSDTGMKLPGSGPSMNNGPWWKNKAVITGIVVVVLILAVGAYAGMRSRGDDGKVGLLPGSEDREQQKEEEPKASSEISGLSGRSCDEANRRPIGVMLAGDPINRPVSGFGDADLVFELPVLVSDVTRLTAVYQCGRPDEIGSVRSARHDYLFLAEGIDAIVGHWGGSYHALNRIAAGEFQTINALSNPYNAYYRKNNLPAPYNGFTSYEGLWNALQKLGYRTETKFVGYKFKDDAPQNERSAGGTLSIGWPGAFRVSYTYDPATNRYPRSWAGVKQVDGKTNAVVAPSAVVVMRATNGPAEGPGGYNDVGIEGKGTMEVYQDGKVIKGTWEKNELDKKDPLHFKNEEGGEIIFTRGQIWIMAVEPHIAVTWTPAASAEGGVQQ